MVYGDVSFDGYSHCHVGGSWNKNKHFRYNNFRNKKFSVDLSIYPLEFYLSTFYISAILYLIYVYIQYIHLAFIYLRRLKIDKTTGLSKSYIKVLILPYFFSLLLSVKLVLSEYTWAMGVCLALQYKMQFLKAVSI